MNSVIFFSVIICYQNCNAFKYMDKNGVTVTYNITRVSMCRTEKETFRRILDVSLLDCVKECGLRVHCKALSYRRQTHCDLFTVADKGNLTNGNCIYVSASDIKVENGLCGTCSFGESCDIFSKDCKHKECLSKDIDGGIVLGNKNELGSMIRYKCNRGYRNINRVESAVCQGQGQWSAIADCAIVQESNVAELKPTTMSSVLGNYTGDKGVDNNSDQNLWLGKSCFHSREELGPWWRVDLEGIFGILRVILFNRLECCSERANNLRLSIGTSLQSMVVVSTVPGQIDDIHTFNLPEGLEARYVQVTLEGVKTLSLCEVQVFGFPMNV